jgi:serine/threonine protein kinase
MAQEIRGGLNADRWQRIKEIYDAAERAAPELRASLIAQLCDGDTELRGDVEALFFEDEETGERIQDAIGRNAAAYAGTLGRQERFGPYRIIRQIGRGGMGAVYEAIRVDDFSKKVALKIVRQELDSDVARARFQQERQVLAALEHPNIARLLDGGETNEGSPYLVLEFVDGVPLDSYCEGLGRVARLRLFLKICAAVEYAHHKLVIHRDLKPANILVTDAGEPKLLDFGIAKLLEPGGERTVTGLVALTPEYASPEQVRGLPISTASDVYSLGVILYRLLTGREPYKADASSAVSLARSICETAPDPPGLGDELDHILLMALRKEPERRYADVGKLAEDIERYLDHRPVLARPDTITYRTTKFLRRNRVFVTAAVLIAATVAAGFVATLRAERRARARFDQVRQLATHFLFDFDRDIRQLPGSTAAREHLVKTAFEQLDSLSSEGGNEPALTAELAQAYQSLGDVVGMPGLPSLGHADRAEESYRKACALTRQLMAKDSSPASPYRGGACVAHIRLGYLLAHTGRQQEGRVSIEQGLAFVEPKIAARKADAGDYRAAANGHSYLIAIDLFGYHARSASRHAAQALELMREYQRLIENPPAHKDPKDQPDDPKSVAADRLRARSNLARVMGQTAPPLAAAGELERAASVEGESIAMREAIRRESPNDVENRRELSVSECDLAYYRFNPRGPSLGDLAGAIEAARSAAAIVRTLIAEDPRNASVKHDLATTLQELADIQRETDPKAAEAALREGLDALEAIPVTFHERARHTGLLLATLSGVLRREGRAAEARSALERAVLGYAKEDPTDGRARGDFVSLWQEQQDYRRIWDALTPSTPAAREDIMAAFDLAYCAAQLSSHAGSAEEAARWQSKSAEIWAPWKGKYPGTDRIIDAAARRDTLNK